MDFIHHRKRQAMKRRTLIQGAAAVLAAPTAVFAQAGWPSGPVRIVVGFPPGGGTDALARVVGAKLTQMWGHQVIIETKAGAAGLIAAEHVAQQPGDGTVLLMAHINSHALGPALQGAKLRYNAEKDFVPVCLVGVTPNLLIANPNVPNKSVADVVARCKAEPGKVAFASAGQGSAQQSQKKGPAGPFSVWCGGHRGARVVSGPTAAGEAQAGKWGGGGQVSPVSSRPFCRLPVGRQPEEIAVPMSRG